MSKAKRIDVVQALRALAATVVVLGHGQGSANLAQLSPSRVVTFQTGWGVDLFFLISGFIIVHASKALLLTDQPRFQFFSRRVARVLPLYWGVTLFYVIITTANGGLHYSWQAIAASFLFFPYDGIEAANGLAFPIYNLGWTLNYEMFFYLVFALCLTLGQKRAAGAAIIVMLLLVMIGLVIDIQPTALRFWTQPILLEFCMGMGLALLHERGWHIPVAGRIILPILAIIAIAFQPFVSLMPPIDGTTPNSFVRVLAWGLPMAGVVAAAVLGRPGETIRGFSFARPLGDASYSLYLLHPLMIIVLWRMPILKTWLAETHTATFLVILLLSSSILSIASFRLFEKPMAKAVTYILDRLNAASRQTNNRPLDNKRMNEQA